MGSPIINYYNAILEADIPCYPKTALLVLVKNMDYNTKQTYVGTKKIANQMGASYSTARRALDALEKEHKLIKFVGMHLLHPGSADATQIFEILIKPAPSEDASTLPAYNPPPSDTTSTLRGRQSIQSGASTDSGVALSGVDVVSRDTHTHTYSDAVDAKQHSETGATPIPTSKPRSASSGTPSPNPNRDRTDAPEPTRHPSDSDPSQQSSAAAPAQTLTDDAIRTLVSIFLNITEAECTEEEVEEGWSSLRAYNGHLHSARLALLMFWAFRVSNYWSKVENWQALDMENFLSASGTLDKQFNPEKWRQHDGLVKKFPTAQAVMDFLIPPLVYDFALSPEEICEDGQHIWEDYSHVVQQCSVCGKFRSNPIVTRWTAEDDLEAEYMDLVEFYDPCEQTLSAEEIASLEAEHRRATEREGNCDWTEAQPIVNRLKRTARLLDCRGYGNAELVFSEGSFVYPVDFDPEPIEQVDTLLLAGERPMGIVAPLRERKGEPYIEPWQSGDEKALAELRASAHLRYYHRM